MTPPDILYAHFDRIAGTEIRTFRISPKAASPGIFVVVYKGFPEPDALTGFTFGLSHFHPPGGAHKELMISMRSTDEAWAQACGYLAHKLREQCPFVCGDTINFREEISTSSRMNAFLVSHPAHIASHDTTIDLGIRKVELMELVPLYEEERVWILNGGDPGALLQSCPRRDFMNPNRAPFLPPANIGR